MTVLSARPEDSRMTLLYLIAREFNEDLDLDRILRRVLIATARVVGATSGSFFFLDENENFVKNLYLRGSTVRTSEFNTDDKILQKGFAGWIKDHKQGAIIVDAKEDDRWYVDQGNPHHLAQRSVVSMPLVVGQKVIGILTLTHEKPGYFDNSDLAILSEIANQAITPILNGQIHQLEQRRLKISNMQAEFARQMNASANLNDLYELIFDQLATLVEYDQTIIFLVEAGHLVTKAARGLKNLAELKDIQVRPYKNDYSLPVTTDYTLLRSDDLQTENTWFKDVTDTASRGWMAVPLVTDGGLEGVLTLARTVPEAYSDDDLELVNMLASQAVIALHSTKLLTQMQAAERRYTGLFEDSSDLLLMMSVDGVILDANRKACQILRRPKDALVGTDLALLGQNLKDVFNEHKDKLLLGREVTVELSIKDAYGYETPVEISAKQLHIQGEEAVQWAGRDVTARHELERMKQDLTNMIVHDLRSPMGTLLGTVEILPFLIKPNATNEEIAEALNMLQIAIRTGKTLKDLVDSMLDLTKLEQGTFPLNLRSVRLAELLAEVYDQISPQSEAKDMKITFDKVDESLYFDLDGSIIRRILVNLIDNAIKYTQSEGKIDLQVSVSDQTLGFKVIDNGPGIPKRDQAQVFEKFGRVDHHSKIQGAGLGLAFCKMAVEAHHGRIWLESRVKRGSTFFVEIPRNLAELIDPL